jgi:hypothetical protein
MTTDRAVSGPRKTIIALASAVSMFSACTTQAAPRPDHTNASSPGAADSRTRSSEASSRMRITVGSKVFTATLSDNATANAFKARLPLTVNMTDLNANEKYVDLADDLPRRASNPGTIHTGDVMLYGATTLVLFYKTFTTSYSYTRIAKVDDPSGLAATLGSGNVMVKFEL